MPGSLVDSGFFVPDVVVEYVPPGTLALLSLQTLEDGSIWVAIKIGLDESGKISKIDLNDPDMYGPYEKYICRLVFDDDRSVALFDKGSGIYSAIVCRNYSLKPELVTKEVYASYYKKSDTAILVEGDMRGGGLAIAPFKFDPSNVIFPGQRNHDEEIYIEEEDSVEYLLPFLEEFYDHELNNKFRLDYFGEYSPYGDCFEWYGTPNFYSFSGIEHLIRHITEFTDRTPPEYYGSEINNAGSDARIAAINKYNRAMDFYRRICYLLGVMINNADGYDNIAVCGP